MAAILPFLKEAVFEDQMTGVMGTAFDSACAQLAAAGWTSESNREILAKLILAHAQQGENDPSKLADAALRAIGFEQGMAGQGGSSAQSADRTSEARA